MTARRLTGLDALHAAAVTTAPALYVLPIEDIPRVGLTTEEVAAVTGFPVDRIRREIRAGRIRHINGGRNYIIPVSELQTIMSWAAYSSDTG